MITLIDLAKKIMLVQETIDSMEIKGVKNAKAAVSAYEQCNEILEDLKATVEEIQNGSKAGEIDAEHDSGSA